MKLEITQWHRVEEEGLPEDGTICFLITEPDGSDWSIGGYDEDNHAFYADFGMGGMVTPEESVYAWADITDGVVMIK